MLKVGVAPGISPLIRSDDDSFDKTSSGQQCRVDAGGESNSSGSPAIHGTKTSGKYHVQGASDENEGTALIKDHRLNKIKIHGTRDSNGIDGKSLDHAGNQTFCWKIRRFLHRVYSTHQFKNLQVSLFFYQINKFRTLRYRK